MHESTRRAVSERHTWGWTQRLAHAADRALVVSPKADPMVSAPVVSFSRVAQLTMAMNDSTNVSLCNRTEFVGGTYRGQEWIVVRLIPRSTAATPRDPSS